MNYVFISPNFPTNFKNFAIGLKAEGVTVLGIGTENYDSLDIGLKNALTEYYKVDNMDDYNQMLRACAFLTFKHGKINYIESHNEYWLELDARLRTDFNVPGLKTIDLPKIKHKSIMKDVFRKIGVPVARGSVVKTLDEALELIAELSYPICAKPNQGVGATNTYKINNDEDLQSFFRTKTNVDYIIEEFIDGEIHTFDGFVDNTGNVVTMSSMIYSKGLMETVNQDLDSVFFIQRVIPDDLIEISKKILKAFDLKAQFFHLEYFRLLNGDLVALELNARPPGGLCLETINYSMDDDIYRQYAHMIAAKTNGPILNSKPYYCGFVGLKLHASPPIHYMEENREKFGDLIVYAAPNPPLFKTVMGDYAVILRHPNLDELKKAMNFVRER
ncbi:MAG: ATP-grasp domain-containing protein [Gudongella sp.]|nr:ATP-grasp domain-containing protein [Gudongella sp.]